MSGLRDLLAMFLIGALTGAGLLVLLTTPGAQPGDAAPTGAPAATVAPTSIGDGTLATVPDPEIADLAPAVTRTLLRWGAITPTGGDELAAHLPPAVVRVLADRRSAVAVWEERR